MLHSHSAQDEHVSSVTLVSGVPFKGRLFGDWSKNRFFYSWHDELIASQPHNTLNVPSQQQSHPIFSFKNEVADMGFRFVVKKEKVQALECNSRWVACAHNFQFRYLHDFCRFL